MNKKIIVIILVILIVVLGTSTGILGYKYAKQKNEMDDLYNTVEEIGKVIESGSESAEDTNSAEVVEKVVEKASIAKIDIDKLDYDSNLYNVSENIAWDESSIGLEMYVSKDKEITVRIMSEAMRYYGVEGESSEITYKFPVTDKTPVCVCFSSGVKAFVLMDDGTVSYITGEEMLHEAKTLHQVEGVNNVVEIRKIIYGRLNGGGNIGTVAIFSDGTSKLLV